VVFHEDGVVIEWLKPDGAQEMGEPVAARFQFEITDGLARLRHDDRRLAGARFGMQPWIHAPTSPSRGQSLLAGTAS
jgi:hypothetical protein